MSILKKQKLTVFSSVHDLNVASCYCDKIILMKAGKIVAVGTPEEMFTPERILYLFGVHTQVTVNSVTKKPNIVFIPSEEMR